MKNAHFLFAGLAMLVSSTLVACGATNTIQTIYVTATPVAIPTAGTGVPFAIATSAAVAASVALPAGGGYSGTMNLGGQIQTAAHVDETMQNTLPSSVPPLVMLRKPASLNPAQVLIYFSLAFDARTPAVSSPVPANATPAAPPTDPPPAPLGLSIAIPPAAQIPGAAYYLAFYDPLRPSLGWQEGFEGPLATSATLTFSGNAASFTRFVQCWFAVYVTSPQIAKPTPAPSISALVTPTPPPSVLLNLQNVFAIANSCTGSPCAAGPTGTPKPTAQPPVPYALATNVPVPSLSGSSTQFTVFPHDAHGDVLWYTPALVMPPLATNFTWDFWFLLSGPLVAGPHNDITGFAEALEFDFNTGVPGYAYNFSSQCVFQGSGSISPTQWEWQIWGFTAKGTLNWVDSGMDCHPEVFNPLSAGNSWHHIVWNYAIYPDTQQKQYLDLTIDGAAPMVPSMNAVATGEARAKGDKQFAEVQYQLDMRPVPSGGPAPTPTPAFSEWVDNVTLTLR